MMEWRLQAYRKRDKRSSAGKVIVEGVAVHVAEAPARRGALQRSEP